MKQIYTIQLNGALPEYLRQLDQCGREADRLTALIDHPECSAEVMSRAEAVFKQQDQLARIVGGMVLRRARDAGALGVSQRTSFQLLVIE